MKKKFQEALTDIDDKYINEAATYKKSGKALTVWRVIAIAACALLALSVTSVALFSVTRVGSKGGSKLDSGYDYENAYSYTEDAVPAAGMYNSSPMTPETAAAADVEGSSESQISSGSSGSPANIADSISKGKIIYTAYINMQSKEYDDSIQAINDLTEKYGAYCEEKNLSGGSTYRNAYYVIRIPAENYKQMISDLDSAATIIRLNESSEDVSERYTDIESRVSTAKTKLARLQELLAQAQDVSDMITIENAISDVEWELDNLQGSLNYYDSQVAYSTITIDLNEVYKTSPSETPKTFGEKLSGAFQNGLSGFGQAMGNFLVWLAASWLWLLLIGVIIAAGIIIPVTCVKKARKRNLNK